MSPMSEMKPTNSALITDGIQNVRFFFFFLRRGVDAVERVPTECPVIDDENDTTELASPSP